MVPDLLASKGRATLSQVMARIVASLDELSDGINAGVLDPVVWHNEAVQVLMVGHTAAYLDGRGEAELTLGARRLLAAIVGEQTEYLNRFLDQVEADGWDDARDRARLRMYAGAIKATHSRGKHVGLDLPAWPGDGSTECLTNCRCQWDVRWIDREELDADAYWRMGPAEHCPTCRHRARQWNPVRIRGGEVQR